MPTLDAPPSDNLYIYDLPAAMDDSTLLQVFSKYGEVRQHRLMPGPTQCGALVRFSTVQQATWVKENLNGNIPEGLSSPIQVYFADTPETRAARRQAKGFTKGWESGKGGERY